MEIQVSVILVTFHSDYEKILETVDSILIQSDINFEIIVSEDSDDNGYYAHLEDYFIKNKFFKYIFIKNHENQGTVKNVLNALKKSGGNCIKGISPGDRFFDKYVLKDMYEKIISSNAVFVFGEVYCYYKKNKKDFWVNRKYPELIKPYLSLDYKKIAKNIILKDDNICGASIMFQRKIFIDYLEIIKNDIKYCEDFVARLMTLDQMNIAYINKIVIFYEYGTGISTKKNVNNTKSIMREDGIKQGDIMLRRYPQYSRWIQRMRKRNSIIKNSWLGLVFQEAMITPEYTIHKIKMKLQYLFKELNSN